MPFQYNFYSNFESSTLKEFQNSMDIHYRKCTERYFKGGDFRKYNYLYDEDVKNHYLLTIKEGLNFLSIFFPNEFFESIVEIFNRGFGNCEFYIEVLIHGDDYEIIELPDSKTLIDVEHYKLGIFVNEEFFKFCTNCYVFIHEYANRLFSLTHINSVVLSRNYRSMPDNNTLWLTLEPKYIANYIIDFINALYLNLTNLRNDLFFEAGLQNSTLSSYKKNYKTKLKDLVITKEKEIYFINNHRKKRLIDWISTNIYFKDKPLFTIGREALADRGKNLPRNYSFACAALCKVLLQKGWLKPGLKAAQLLRMFQNEFGIELKDQRKLDSGKYGRKGHKIYIDYFETYWEIIRDR